MKESRYNYFVPFNDRIVCFNGMSGKIFSVNKYGEFESVKKCLNNQGSSSSNLSDFLYDSKFLVDDLTDEVSLIKLKNRMSVFDNEYHIIINPTLECNFNCWYCYEKSEKGYMSVDIIERVKLNIKNAIINKGVKKLVISWFGGEPLLYIKEVISPISVYAKELCEEVGGEFVNNATTNGYLLDKSNFKILKSINLKSFQITLDGNPTEHDRIRNANGIPSFGKIINNIISVCTLSKDSTVALRINYTNKTLKNDFEKTLSVIPENIRRQIRVNFQRVWQTRTQNSKERLMSGIKSVSGMGFIPDACGGFTIGKYYHCYADRFNFAHVNYDGKVYRCTARDYSEKYVCGTLKKDGNIRWKSGINEQMFTSSNFDNEKCLECKLLPICVGPCFQNYKDYKDGNIKSFCFVRNDDINVNDFIIQHYLQTKASYHETK
ncbi:MAG: radical SAM protein [Bacteroidales bacterium]